MSTIVMENTTQIPEHLLVPLSYTSEESVTILIPSVRIRMEDGLVVLEKITTTAQAQVALNMDLETAAFLARAFGNMQQLSTEGAITI